MTQTKLAKDIEEKTYDSSKLFLETVGSGKIMILVNIVMVALYFSLGYYVEYAHIVYFLMLMYVAFVWVALLAMLNLAVSGRKKLDYLHFAAAGCSLVFSYAMLYSAYHLEDPSMFPSVPVAYSVYDNFVTFLYFSVTTTFTVGYGDIHPKGNIPRLTIITHMLTSFIVLVVILSMVV